MRETPTASRTVTIAKRRFELRRDRVERAVQGVLPDPIASHYVVIDNRRYPPKQVIGLLTGLDRADYTSHQARRVLMGLGFAVGRRPQADSATSSSGGDTRGGGVGMTDAGFDEPTAVTSAAGHELAQMLVPLRGQWVATRGDDLLIAASTPQEVVGWLARHDQRADSMFRVPEDELASGGLAPL